MTVTKIHNNQNEAKSQEKKQHQNNTIDLKKKNSVESVLQICVCCKFCLKISFTPASLPVL
jgi:hypothetical protein